MEDLDDWISELRLTDKPIIVEGKKDKAALENLGIKNVLKISKPIYNVIERLAARSKKAIILTDLDKEGRRLYSKIKHHLQRHGVKVDTKFREFLFKKTRLTQIEGLKRRWLNGSYRWHSKLQ